MTDKDQQSGSTGWPGGEGQSGMPPEGPRDGLNFTFPKWVLVVALVLAAFVAWYLKGEGGVVQMTTADHTDRRLVTQGRLVYLENCARCHGVELQGQANWRTPKADGTLPAPPHDETGHTWHHTDEQNFAYTKYGAAVLGDAAANFKSGMPAFDDVLTDEDIWAALAYIKSRWPEEIREAQPRAE